MTTPHPDLEPIPDRDHVWYAYHQRFHIQQVWRRTPQGAQSHGFKVTDLLSGDTFTAPTVNDAVEEMQSRMAADSPLRLVNPRHMASTPQPSHSGWGPAHGPRAPSWRQVALVAGVVVGVAALWVVLAFAHP